jgi:muconolactone delta-isomerase
LALLVTRDGIRNVALKVGDRWVELTRFTEPVAIHAYDASPDGRHAFVWHGAGEGRTVTIFDLSTREETDRFVTRLDSFRWQSLRWTAAGTLLHLWHAGTEAECFQVHDPSGEALFGGIADGYSVSPSVRYLALLRILPIEGNHVRVWDLAKFEKVAEIADSGIRSVRRAYWEGDDTLVCRYVDEEDRAHELRVPQRLVRDRALRAIRSPDGTLTAVILEKEGESVLNVRKADSCVWSRSFLSPDHEHGWRVLECIWSPGGARLAYRLESSGGHQPWITPVNVLELESGDVADLSRLLGEKGATQDDPDWGPALSFLPGGTLRFFGRCDSRDHRHEHRYNPVSGKVRCVRKPVRE